MNNTIKKILPNVIVEQLQIIRRKNLFKGKTIKDTFTEIKESNYWDSDESLSGAGSEIEVIKPFAHELELLMTELEIKSILDLPCGDFNWMKTINLDGIDYIGGDIVSSLIEDNIKNYESANKSFIELDVTNDLLPKVDLIFCRDCLVHFSYKDIYRALKNFKKSNSKYLLTTSFLETETNFNIVTGDWRKMNLEIEPFNLKSPIKVINEKNTQKRNRDADKSLCLWEIGEINISLKMKLYNWLT